MFKKYRSVLLLIVVAILLFVASKLIITGIMESVAEDPRKKRLAPTESVEEAPSSSTPDGYGETGVIGDGYTPPPASVLTPDVMGVSALESTEETPVAEPGVVTPAPPAPDKTISASIEKKPLMEVIQTENTPEPLMPAYTFDPYYSSQEYLDELYAANPYYEDPDYELSIESAQRCFDCDSAQAEKIAEALHRSMIDQGGLNGYDYIWDLIRDEEDENFYYAFMMNSWVAGFEIIIDDSGELTVTYKGPQDYVPGYGAITEEDYGDEYDYDYDDYGYDDVYGDSDVKTTVEPKSTPAGTTEQ